MENNSSNFLFQNGGGLQQQSGLSQSSNSNALTSSSNPLFPDAASGTGISRQDILGQATVVGPVEFSASNAPSSQQTTPQDNNGIDFGGMLVFAVLVAAIVVFGIMAKKIIRT